jgi:hypothetical protein
MKRISARVAKVRSEARLVLTRSFPSFFRPLTTASLDSILESFTLSSFSLQPTSKTVILFLVAILFKDSLDDNCRRYIPFQKGISDKQIWFLV